MTAVQPGLVVVPVDFSSDCSEAIRVARRRVADAGSLHIVHVLPPLDFSTPAVLHKFASGENRQDLAHEQLDELMDQAGVVGAEPVVLEGDPGLKVVDYAKEIEAELIVVTSTGRHGVQRLLLGSTAERIVRHAHCSVLVLRRRAGK